MTGERKTVHAGGVGVNTRYDVFDGNEKIGSIARYGNHGFRISGRYNFEVGNAATLSAARDKAMTAEFPSEQDAWNAHYDKTLAARRAIIENANGQKLARLSRAVLDGSNEARVELMELLDAMARSAADPDYTGHHWLPNFGKRRFLAPEVSHAG